MCEKDFSIEFYIICCDEKSCGLLFAIPTNWDNLRRKDKRSFYCPNGHSMSYRGETKEQKLRKQLKVAKNDHAQCIANLGEVIEDREELIKNLTHSRAYYKGKVTQLTKNLESAYQEEV